MGDHEVNVAKLQTPTELLKFGRGGKPGFRTFRLSPDLTSLTWSSKSKTSDQTKVDIKNIKEIRFGQRTEKFKKNNRPDLESLSFSLIYDEGNNVTDTLDLVCKDEREFQTWTRTLQALMDGKVDTEMWIQSVKREAKEASSPSAKAKSKEEITRDAFQESNDVYAFGWGEWGQNGLGQRFDASDVSVAQPKLLERLLGKGVIDASCGWAHSAVLLESGQVLCYGNRLGTGLHNTNNPHKSQFNVPLDPWAPTLLKVTEKMSVMKISCGAYHTVIIDNKGNVYSWGVNLNGQLGLGDQVDRTEPTLIPDLVATADRLIVDVRCGLAMTAALAEEGHVLTWGSGDSGQLGHSDKDDQTLPTLVKELAGVDVVKIAVGDCHMFAATKSELYAWGWNGCGQLGLEHEEDTARPAVVEALRGYSVVDMDCGAAHSVAIVYVPAIDSNVVYSWGANITGQAGQGKKKRLLKPHPLGDLSKACKFVEARCGSNHSVIRSAEGHVWSTGSNKFGQLGHGNTVDLDEFKAVDFFKGKNARLIACGGQHTAVLTARAWVDDSEAKQCMACKQPFTFVNRKHHCRNCFGIFCNACSSKKIALLKLQQTEPVRVCGSCYTKLGGR